MKMNEEVLSRYGKSEGVNNAVLVLYKEPKQPKQEEQVDEVLSKRQKITTDGQEIEIPVVKEFLMFQSPVFKKIFTSLFKEATTCRVELPGKNIDSVIHMLDYLYPTRSFMIDDQKAAALLPLADEYQIEGLKKLCVTELKKFAVPRLEYVSLGIIYNLDDLLSAAIETCAKKLGLEEIDRQQNLPENKDIVDDKVVLRILRRKTKIAGTFMNKLLPQCLEAISNGDTPSITANWIGS